MIIGCRNCPFLENKSRDHPCQFTESEIMVHLMAGENCGCVHGEIFAQWERLFRCRHEEVTDHDLEVLKKEVLRRWPEEHRLEEHRLEDYWEIMEKILKEK